MSLRCRIGSQLDMFKTYFWSLSLPNAIFICLLAITNTCCLVNIQCFPSQSLFYCKCKSPAVYQEDADMASTVHGTHAPEDDPSSREAASWKNINNLATEVSESIKRNLFTSRGSSGCRLRWDGAWIYSGPGRKPVASGSDWKLTQYAVGQTNPMPSLTKHDDDNGAALPVLLPIKIDRL